MRAWSVRRDVERVVVPREEQGGVGDRGHAERLTLPPVLDLVRWTRATLGKMPVRDADDRVVDVDRHGELIARHDERHTVGVGAGGKDLGRLVKHLEVAVVARVGVRLATATRLAVVAADGDDADGWCDGEARLNDLDDETTHERALLAFVQLDHELLRRIPALAALDEVTKSDEDDVGEWFTRLDQLTPPRRDLVHEPQDALNGLLGALLSALPVGKGDHERA